MIPPELNKLVKRQHIQYFREDTYRHITLFHGLIINENDYFKNVYMYIWYRN